MDTGNDAETGVTPEERDRLQELEEALSAADESEDALRRYYDEAKRIFDRHPGDPEAESFYNQADALYKHGQAGG